MKIKHTFPTHSFILSDVPTPMGCGVEDPITVVLKDNGGSCQVIVECFGSAWSHTFGAIGDERLLAFVASCDALWLADKLLSNTTQPFNRRTTAWVRRISRAVVLAAAQLVHNGPCDKQPQEKCA